MVALIAVAEARVEVVRGRESERGLVVCRSFGRVIWRRDIHQKVHAGQYLRPIGPSEVIGSNRRKVDNLGGIGKVEVRACAERVEIPVPTPSI